MSELTQQEYERLVALLGREPNPVELGMTAAMWSEHCSYKSSKVHLQRLPTSAPYIIQGPGENAGIVDIGDGWCLVFKIESHNHPSFIEPYQGAATGVGGILRDIFTMGARPFAILDSLRFGPLSSPRNRSILNGVVGGIGGYGNSTGIPTVAGETFFADCYSNNPLVNAMAVGIARQEQIFYGRASGKGNAVLYVGARTGRDGIHGATMASAQFDERALEQRPAVQVGDPFLEKLLIEACLDAMRSQAIVGIQDMGAAGLTCSSSEMSTRGLMGMELNLDRVPQRETGMTAYEILLSESQERMLLVVRAGHERQVSEIFNKWDLEAAEVGRVTDDGRLRILHHGEIVADIPARILTDEAPVYNRPIAKPAPPPEPDWSAVHMSSMPLGEQLKRMLGSPNLCSKEWIYRQYDHTVRTNTLVLPGADAAVLRVKETRKAIALTVDGNARYCFLNPRQGARLAVAEACRNLAVCGAQPLALTNCLNFASPEHHEVMWAFSEVIDGMAEACSFFGTPITGGNVSLYNETDGQGIFPTPVVGLVGLIDDPKPITTHGRVGTKNHCRNEVMTTHWFKDDGDLIVLFGVTTDDLGGSEYLAWIHQQVAGQPPSLDLDLEKRVQQTCQSAIREGIVKSAHDCSDGGLAVALAECCFSQLKKPSVGAQVQLTTAGVSSEASLMFSESPSRIIISIVPDDLCRMNEIASENRIPYTVIGQVGGSRLRLWIDEKLVVDEAVEELEEIWRTALEKYF